jgi:putative NIF3 family GTP cyclohydrolase 1 type 2
VPVSLQTLIQTMKSKLGVETIRYACPVDKTLESIQINSIAVYVGSGAFALLGAPADLYITGEMFHHDILAAVAAGKVVILLDHSSSERPFLPELARRLKDFTYVSEVMIGETDIEPIRVA